MSTLSLYDTDFSAWAYAQAEHLKRHEFKLIDLGHLIQEVEEMGNQNRQELKNRLVILLMHLLKWNFQSERKGNICYQTIANQRLDIQDLMSDNPSLKHILDEVFLKAYSLAIAKASIETGINKKVFPLQSPWTIKQILNEDFYPE